MMTARALVDRGGTLIGLALVAAIFGALIGPQFFAPANLELMARQTAIVGMAALGMTMVIVAGGIDLSVGSVIALSTVVIALLLKDGQGPWVAALGGIGAGAICGLANGLLITRLRVVPFIVTLGTMLIVRGAAKGLADERRIEAPTTWLNDLLRSGAQGTWPAAGHLAGDRARARSWAACSATRDSAGICSRSDRTSAWRGCAASGSSGAKWRCMPPPRHSRAPPGCCSSRSCRSATRPCAVGLELDVIAAVIIGGGSLSGGRGTVLGTLVGATIMTLIQIGCSQKGLPNWVQQIVTGGIIVAAVALDRMRAGRS